jgi:hypothetical protein
MPVISRAETTDARWSSNSARILWVVSTFITLFAVAGAVAICLIGFSVFRPGKPTLKAPADIPVLPVTKESPNSRANTESASTPALSSTDQARSGMIAEDRSFIEQTAVPAPNPISVSAPAPAAQTAAAVSGTEIQSGESAVVTPAKPEWQISEIKRKRLERARRRAERQRSRMEEMYRNHAISDEAYKMGSAKYRHQIERYRKQMRPPTDEAQIATAKNP